MCKAVTRHCAQNARLSSCTVKSLLRKDFSCGAYNTYARGYDTNRALKGKGEKKTEEVGREIRSSLPDPYAFTVSSLAPGPLLSIERGMNRFGVVPRETQVRVARSKKPLACSVDVSVHYLGELSLMRQA